MLEKLKVVEKRYTEIGEELMLPETVSDNNLYKKLMQEHKSKVRYSTFSVVLLSHASALQA